jgi:hypothetical protein
MIWGFGELESTAHKLLSIFMLLLQDLAAKIWIEELAFG